MRQLHADGTIRQHFPNHDRAASQVSLQFEAADAESDLPSPDHAQEMAALFAHLDGVIDHASRTRQLALGAGDETAGGALDDAISLLHHVRSRLRYDLDSTV